MTGLAALAVASLVWAGVAVVVLGWLVWVVVTVYRDGERERREAVRVAREAERQRVEQRARVVTCRLQQHAWLVRHEMLRRVVWHQQHAARSGSAPSGSVRSGSCPAFRMGGCVVHHQWSAPVGGTSPTPGPGTASECEG